MDSNSTLKWIWEKFSLALLIAIMLYAIPFVVSWGVQEFGVSDRVGVANEFEFDGISFSLQNNEVFNTITNKSVCGMYVPIARDVSISLTKDNCQDLDRVLLHEYCHDLYWERLSLSEQTNYMLYCKRLGINEVKPCQEAFAEACMTVLYEISWRIPHGQIQ